MVSAASDLASSLNSGSATVTKGARAGRPEHRHLGRRDHSLLNEFTAANNSVVTGLQTGGNVASAEDTREIDRDPARATDRRLDRRRQRLRVHLHRQRRHPVPGCAERRLLHSDPDARRRRERRAGHRRRRADHRRQFADAHSVGRTRRLCSATRHARARISGPARRDRRRPHQRLRRKRSIGHADAALAARPVHRAGGDQPALDDGDDGSRRHDRGQSECRRGAGQQSESPPRRRHLRPGNPAYTYNSTGSANYTGRIQELAGEISASQSFNPSAGLGSSSSLADYANASVSRLQGENQQASDFLLSECARHPGDLGVVECDRRQSRRRDDEHAQPRKLLRLVGEALDHRHQHVLGLAGRRMTTMSAILSPARRWPRASCCRRCRPSRR